MTTLILIRHGQSEANKLGVFAAVFAALIPGRDGSVEPITMAVVIGGALILCGVIRVSVNKSSK